MTVAASPVRSSRLEITVSGGSGTVTITGTVGGSPTSEDVVFDGTLTTMQSSALFDGVSAVDVVGFAGQTLSVRAIGRDGSPQKTIAVVVSGWPASVDTEAPRWDPVGMAGRTDDGRSWITIPWTDTFTPQTGDWVDDDQGRRWEISGAPRPGGTNIAQHWYVHARRREGDQ